MGRQETFTMLFYCENPKIVNTSKIGGRNVIVFQIVIYKKTNHAREFKEWYCVSNNHI